MDSANEFERIVLQNKLIQDSLESFQKMHFAVNSCEVEVSEDKQVVSIVFSLSIPKKAKSIGFAEQIRFSSDSYESLNEKVQNALNEKKQLLYKKYPEFEMQCSYIC